MYLLTATLLATMAANAPEGKARPGGSAELDIPYAAGGDQQKLDLYLPTQKGFATVVFTYGGGWHRGSRKSVTPIGEKLRNLGFGCALLSHRLAPQDKFPAQIEDVATAFAWVKQNIRDKGGDRNRVFLMGHSSGAHLSLLLATDARWLARHKLVPSDIAGVVGLSPPVDLEPRPDKRGFGDALLAGKGADVFARDAALMKTASPIQHISKNLPPTLLIVGDHDFPMLTEDAKAFAAKARESGAQVDTFTAKDCDHMAVVRSLLDRNSPVLERVLAFLRKLQAEAR
jgi:acetyl esterase/lipase